jgi:hypothetical protein
MSQASHKSEDSGMVFFPGRIKIWLCHT